MFKKKQHYKEDKRSVNHLNNIATLNALKGQNDTPAAIYEAEDAIKSVTSRGRQLNTKTIVIEKKNLPNASLGEPKVTIIQSKSKNY